MILSNNLSPDRLLMRRLHRWCGDQVLRIGRTDDNREDQAIPHPDQRVATRACQYR